MPMELLFWIIFLLWIVFYAVGYAPQGAIWWGRGWPIFLIVLIGLLGWQVFGRPIH
jgi:hypothetical protein